MGITTNRCGIPSLVACITLAIISWTIVKRTRSFRRQHRVFRRLRSAQPRLDPAVARAGSRLYATFSYAEAEQLVIHAHQIELQGCEELIDGAGHIVGRRIAHRLAGKLSTPLGPSAKPTTTTKAELSLGSGQPLQADFELPATLAPTFSGRVASFNWWLHLELIIPNDKKRASDRASPEQGERLSLVYPVRLEPAAIEHPRDWADAHGLFPIKTVNQVPDQKRRWLAKFAGSWRPKLATRYPLLFALLTTGLAAVVVGSVSQTLSLRWSWLTALLVLLCAAPSFVLGAFAPKDAQETPPATSHQATIRRSRLPLLGLERGAVLPLAGATGWLLCWTCLQAGHFTRDRPNATALVAALLIALLAVARRPIAGAFISLWVGVTLAAEPFLFRALGRGGRYFYHDTVDWRVAVGLALISFALIVALKSRRLSFGPALRWQHSPPLAAAPLLIAGTIAALIVATF